MSLNTILSTATTGLMAAQQGLRTVSDNVANVNTPGYVRKVVDQSSMVTLGAGSGVDVIGVRRVIDRYLQSASLTSASTAGSAAINSDMLDRVQSLFGDPSGASSFFGRLDAAFSDFATLSNDPASVLQRSQSLTSLQSFFDEAGRISASLNDMRAEAETRLKSDVQRANELLSQISQLNGDISRAKFGGADSSGAENIQAQLVNELSGLIDFQMAARPTGGVILRTNDGQLLADDKAAGIGYNSSATGAAYLTLTSAQGGQSFEANFTGGEIVGLLQARDQTIPGAISQLTEFVGKAAEEINRVHNGYTAVPPPSSLNGKNTGLDQVTAAANFTGRTTLAILDSASAVQNRVAIDFSAHTITVDAGAPISFGASPNDFVTQLNAAMTGAGIGSASFSGGALTLTAASGGIAIADDPADPATKAGQGFSQFFGLNDLVKSTSFAPYETGLAAGDAHGFTPGQTITLRISDASGSRMRDVAIAVPNPPLTSMGDLLNTLNAPGTGVGGYGQFTLDAAGRMTFAPAAGTGATISVLSDTTARGAGGPSISALFGVGPAAAQAAAASFSVNNAIKQNPQLLAVGKVDLTVAAGQSAVALGDGSGAAALAAAGDRPTNFVSVNGFSGGTTSVSRYGAEFAGLLGRRAATAETQRDSAEAIHTEAENRRTSYEGVNTDEELVNMTTYQQAFNASARLIQAARDMYDTLLAMVN